MTKTIEESLAALVAALPAAPDQAVIDRWRADLTVVSSGLLSGAIQEFAGAVLVRPEKANVPDIREEIYRIYNRKVAEHAQMFPMFHTLETAFRANLASELETHYGIQAWWEPVLKAMMSSARDLKAIRRIGVIDVKPDIPYRMSKIVQVMLDKKIGVPAFKTGVDFVEACDFAHLIHLVEDHWSLFAGKFHFKGRAVPRQTAVAFLERIRLARNAVYHHQSFEGAPGVYDAADVLLQCLGVRLAKIHPAIAGAHCKPPPYFPKPAAAPEAAGPAEAPGPAPAAPAPN